MSRKQPVFRVGLCSVHICHAVAGNEGVSAGFERESSRAKSIGMIPPALLHVFPTLDVGGQQTRFATIANRLGPKFRHRLISLNGGVGALSLLDPVLDAHLIPNPLQTRGRLGQFHWMARLLETLKPDVLITYNWGAIEWAILNRLCAGLKHIHLEDGFGPDEADRQIWRRLMTRRFTLRRSTLVVPSRQLVKIATCQWGLDPERVVYIPNGIDPTRFDRVSPENAAPLFERREGECVIGSFSPLRPEKNLGRLLHAFASIQAPSRAVRLVVCGDGPELAPLQELAKRLRVDDTVTFTGHVARPEAVMGAFDVFAITSDTEQMPYAVLEAMSARLPIVATAVGDIPIMVAEENRPLIVPRDCCGALAAVLRKVCADRGLSKKIGLANRTRVEREFGIAQMTEAFHRLLDGNA